MKSMKALGIIMFIMAVTAMLFISGCGGKKTIAPGQPVFTAEEAQLFSHVSTGKISPSGEISVTFVEPQVNDDQVNVPLKKEVFSFKPSIDGVASWKNLRTLVFKPNQPLPFRTVYTVNVEYNELLPAFKDAKPLYFSFETAGREIAELKGDFELVNPDSPSRLCYQGEITLTEAADPASVKDAVALNRGSGALPLLWEEKIKGVVFAFKSQEFTREPQSEAFILTVDKDELDISQTVEKKFTLDPPGMLRISNIAILDQGQNPGLEIFFSDQLDPRQDITGLIRVEPAVKFTFKAQPRSVLLSGEFTYGESYTITASGLRSKWGVTMSDRSVKVVEFEDIKPRLTFLSDGLFMPSINEKKLGFKTVNVKKVKVEVKKVYESNLGQFLQTENINSRKGRYEIFYDYEFNRVGVKVAEKVLEIGADKNRWLTHLLDLGKLVPAGEKGVYIVTISFTRDDMIYRKPNQAEGEQGEDDDGGYYYGDDYYSNVNSHGYLYRNGTIVKPVIFSDIGLIWKGGGDQHAVCAVNLLNAEPMSGVQVTLRSFQNQVLGRMTTNSDGFASFKNISGEVFFIEGEKDGQRSMVKPADMGWNLSTFDTGGEVVSARVTRAFIYTDRGVYRPGDPIHLSMIARNPDNTFPENHPVTLSVYNPKDQAVIKQTSRDSKDGFYSFTFSTRAEDMTGNWMAKLLVGGQTFSHLLKIETVVPNRLKVNVEPAVKRLKPGENRLDFSVSSNYLFGAPAASLRAQVSVVLAAQARVFPAFQGFNFSNQAISFQNVETDILDDNLDPEGKIRGVWELPNLKEAPSEVSATLTARVYEKGGRFTRRDEVVHIDPFPCYVGLEAPKFEYGYGTVGAPVKIRAIALDAEGRPLVGRSLKYRIMRNSNYWWWEYSDRNQFHLRFKKDKFTQEVAAGEISSGSQPQVITYEPQEIGEYLVEVEDKINGGHRAGFFFSAYYWGDTPSDIDTAGTLALASDKKEYKPGDTARITFPVPKKATVLFSVEKADTILRSEFIEASPDAQGRQNVSIDINKEMLPNIYIAVAVIQPLNQDQNDRPLRTYGILPLSISDPETRQTLAIKMPDSLKPGQNFDIQVETGDKKQTQLTLAVVDEGLLDLTRFATPDPWKEFFKKQKLGVVTADIFNFVLGGNRGDIFRLFSIGGDMEADDYRASQLGREKQKRFKPVALFAGPISTDKSGRAKLSFQMPDYYGSVRVMAVSANNGRYGSAEKAVPVKADLMVLPTLPRALGPGDRFTVPVTVFRMNDKISRADVSITCKGPVKISGPDQKEVVFSAGAEQDVYFELEVQPEVNPASIIIEARSSGFSARQVVDIDIRPSSPRIFASETREIFPGGKNDILIPNRGLKGTNRAVIRVMTRPKLNLGSRLGWLIHYPYGCLEQTTSAVFPQLYLKEFVDNTSNNAREIDNNINAGIQRLRRFQIPSGGFAYWPGEKAADDWCSNYAGHFLVEADKRGYSVPAEMLAAWKRFQYSRAQAGDDNRTSRVYRLYILAQAGDPQIGAMNLIRENLLKTLSDTEKWMLAAAYFLSGDKNAAAAIAAKAALTIKPYNETGGNYGSDLRDMGIILESLSIMQEWNKADQLYEKIMDRLSISRDWYATQTLGYCLMAIGKYMQINEGDFRQGKARISGSIQLPGQKKVSFDTDKLAFSLPISEGFGQNAQVMLDEKVGVKKAFIVMDWSGTPLVPDSVDESANLTLTVEWLDENGMAVDPGQIVQGGVFWGHIRVASSWPGRLDNVALVQVLPSGWEIENTRLSGDEVPQWMKGYAFIKNSYVDYRDDRAMWFFNLDQDDGAADFVVKLNAVTTGEFILPPTLVEAMYNNRFKAVKSGRRVSVIAK